MLPGATVISRVALDVAPEVSEAVKVTVNVTALAVALLKVWLADVPVAVPPSPKDQL